VAQKSERNVQMRPEDLHDCLDKGRELGKRRFHQPVFSAGKLNRANLYLGWQVV